MANPTAEEAILTKLAQAPSFHPAGAKLFVPDWTLDSGDVVTVTAKDNVNDPDETPTSYNVPIYSMNLTWNGVNRVEIESTGNQQREPLSALRRKEYQTGRRGYGAAKQIEEQTQQQYEHYTEQTDAYRKEIYRVNGVVYDSNGNIVYQTDPVTGEYILDNAGNKIPVYNPESNGSISGQVIQSAQRMATIIKQSGTVYEVFSETKQYYEGDRVLYPDSNGNPYKFINDHNPGPWKGDGEHGDVVSLGTLQSQIDNNTDNFNIFYGEVNERLGTIEGSQLWGDADELIAINGKMRVDGNKLIIEEGGGLYTERTVSGRKVQSGIWDAGNLTAGMIVQTINGTSETIISADKVNLEGYVTASYVDTAVLLADSLTSDAGYIGNIKASNINTGGNINASGAVYGSGIYLSSTSDGTTTYTSLADAVKTIQKNTDAPEGQIGIKYNTFGNATWIPINFNIADTAYYKSHVGINALDVTEVGQTPYEASTAEEITITSGGYYIVSASPKAGDAVMKKFIAPEGTGTHLVSKGEWANGQITFTAGDTGTATAGVDLGISVAAGQTDSTAVISISDGSADTGETQGLTLTQGTWDYPSPYYKRVQLRNASNGVVAFSDVDASGVYNTGYADGQTNASAAISGVALNRPAQYSDNSLALSIIARPKLVLLSNDDPPVEREVLGERTTVTDSMPVVVTNATLTVSEYTNGGYTISSTGGNVNIDAVDGQGGANIPVSVTSKTITMNATLISASPPTGTSTNPLSIGTYGLYLIKDGQTESIPLTYYRVTSGGSTNYVVSSNGATVMAWNGLTLVGSIYPNTDVTLGSTDQLGRRQVSYNGKSGYVSTSSISTSKGPTNFPGRIGWVGDESDPDARTVYSLSDVILSPSQITTSEHFVTVVYSDGDVVEQGARITVDASAISGGGGSGGVNNVVKYQVSDDSADWASWDEQLQDKITLNSNELYAYLQINANDGSTYNLGINASAIASGGGGSEVDHISKSGNISYSSDYKTATFNVTAYTAGNVGLHTNPVSANVSEAWEQGRLTGRSEVSPYAIQSGRQYTITSNTGSGGVVIYPETIQGQQYDAMDTVRVIVNVQDEYELTSVTEQGQIDSVYVEASSGGYNYYRAGTAATYYKGDGGTYTVQGKSVSVRTAGTVHYYVRHTASEVPTGAWYSRQTDRPTSGVYNTEYGDGGTNTYYNAGTTTVVARGASVSVTPISSSTKKHLLATTRYKAGQTVTDKYYIKKTT